MTPTYEEYKRGATQWRENLKGVGLLLSHHSAFSAEEGPTGTERPGTWAYYLLVREQMYPDQWSEFSCMRDENGFEHSGPAFDRVEFHGGISWSSSEPYFDRRTMREWGGVKVGCDYSHIWDEERGYPDTYDSVLLNAKRSAEQLLIEFPNYQLRCPYSGVWAPNDEFYEAVNGALVHYSILEKPSLSEHWKPAA